MTERDEIEAIRFAVMHGDWPFDSVTYCVRLLAEIDALRARVGELEAETDDYDNLNTRLGALLNATANALKGEPEPNHLHSFHDLAEVATALRTHLAAPDRGNP